MKIVYVSNAALPSREANSIHVMQMARSLATIGHGVVLLAPDRKDVERTADDIWSFYGVERSFDVQKLHCRKSVVGWFLYGLRAALRARKLGADLVYSRNLYASWWVACVLKLPLVWELHELPGRRFWFARAFARQLNTSKHVRRIVAITNGLREDLVAEGFDREKIGVFHDGAPASLVEAEQSSLESITQGNLQVGYIGHLYPGKGMEMISLLVPLCPWADFHVVGGTEADIATWKHRLSRYPNVKFYGFVAPARVKSIVYGLDVALAPVARSVKTAGNGLDISRWTSPLKIIEYMACGRAIVASDLPVLAEVLENDVTALIRPLGAPDEWAAALELLKTDPSLRRKLGQNARTEFLARYSWERRADNVLKTLP